MDTKRLHWRVIGVLSLLGSAAHAGQFDAGTYLLDYDDALGVPVRTSEAGVSTFTFPSFFRMGEGGGASLADSFEAMVTAAPGHRFAVRPDRSFPVWARIELSGFLAYPDVEPPGNPGSPYPQIAFASEASVYSAGTVTAPPAILSDRSGAGIAMRSPLVETSENVAVAGASVGRAHVTLETQVYAIGAIENMWYCPWWKDTCEWMGYFPPDFVHVEVNLTPVIVVDDRFVGAVPEPSTLLMTAGALVALALRRRMATSPRAT